MIFLRLGTYYTNLVFIEIQKIYFFDNGYFKRETTFNLSMQITSSIENSKYLIISKLIDIHTFNVPECVNSPGILISIACVDLPQQSSTQNKLMT